VYRPENNLLDFQKSEKFKPADAGKKKIIVKENS